MSDKPALFCYISYSRKINEGYFRVAKEMQKQLQGRLRSQGYNAEVFLDVKTIDGGDDWPEENNIWVKKAHVLLPIIDAQFFESKECMKELTLFRDSAKAAGLKPAVIPLILAPKIIDKESEDEVVSFISRQQGKEIINAFDSDFQSSAWKQAMAWTEKYVIKKWEHPKQISGNPSRSTSAQETSGVSVEVEEISHQPLKETRQRTKIRRNPKAIKKLAKILIISLLAVLVGVGTVFGGRWALNNRSAEPLEVGQCLSLTPATLLEWEPQEGGEEQAEQTLSRRILKKGLVPCDQDTALAVIIGKEEITENPRECSYSEGCMSFITDRYRYRFNAIPRVGLCFFGHGELNSAKGSAQALRLNTCSSPFDYTGSVLENANEWEVDILDVRPVQYRIESVHTGDSTCAKGEWSWPVTFGVGKETEICTSQSEPQWPVLSVDDCAHLILEPDESGVWDVIAPLQAPCKPEAEKATDEYGTYRVILLGSNKYECANAISDEGKDAHGIWASNGVCFVRDLYHQGQCSPIDQSDKDEWKAVIPCDQEATDRYPHTVRLDGILPEGESCPETTTLEVDDAGGYRWCYARIK
jgi:hypothetical protein